MYTSLCLKSARLSGYFIALAALLNNTACINDGLVYRVTCDGLSTIGRRPCRIDRIGLTTAIGCGVNVIKVDSTGTTVETTCVVISLPVSVVQINVKPVGGFERAAPLYCDVNRMLIVLWVRRSANLHI